MRQATQAALGRYWKAQRRKMNAKGFTIQQVIDATQLSRTAVYREVRELFDAGRIKMAGKRRERLGLDGRRCLTPVYQFTDKRGRLPGE